MVNLADVNFKLLDVSKSILVIDDSVTSALEKVAEEVTRRI